MRPQVPDCLEFIVFCCVLFWTRAQAHELPLTESLHLFLFLSITDNPCLVLSCLTGKTFCQGAQICPQQLARPCSWGNLGGHLFFFGRLHATGRSIVRQCGLDWWFIVSWSSCSWSSPSLREPLRALVFSSRLHATGRSIVEQCGFDWRFIVSEAEMPEKWLLIRLCFFNKYDLNTWRSTARWRGVRRSFFGRDRGCIHKRLLPRPPQYIPILGFVFCFVRNNPTNEQKTNKPGCSGLSWRCHGSIMRLRASSPALSRTKRGKSKLIWFSTKLKTHFWFWGMPLRLCWRAWRSYDHRFAFADALGLLRATTNKQATSPGTYLIVSRSDDLNFYGVTFCCAAIICSAPALIRTLSVKRSGRLDGDCRGL